MWFCLQRTLETISAAEIVWPVSGRDMFAGRYGRSAPFDWSHGSCAWTPCEHATMNVNNTAKAARGIVVDLYERRSTVWCNTERKRSWALGERSRKSENAGGAFVLV